MAMESRLHDLMSDQVYVIFQALLEGKDHPLHREASDMAREYIKDHQAELMGRGREKMPTQHKRAG